MNEPRTAAGRKLVEWIDRYWRLPTSKPFDEEGLPLILAIEDEARGSEAGLDVERLARVYEQIEPGMDPGLAGEFAAELAAAYAAQAPTNPTVAYLDYIQDVHDRAAQADEAEKP